MIKITPALIRGFNGVRADERKSVFGGIGFNDDYNIETWGITRADYFIMLKILNERYGMEIPTPVSPKHFAG